MKPQKELLQTILEIGHLTSIRGEGISLKDVLSRVGYANIRDKFTYLDLIPLIQANQDLINQWIYYSEDKRTSSGWYILKDGIIGRLEPKYKIVLNPIEAAVAEYVVLELDFWAGI